MSTTRRQPFTTLLARDVMRAPIVACDPATELSDVADRMRRHRIHAVIVDGIARGTGGDRLVWAVVSDLDLVRAAVRADGPTTAGSVAASPVVCVDVADDLVTVGAALAENDCAHAVVTEGDRPVGVVSTLDLVAVLAPEGDAG
ncbi:CBS domain-containing protein [Patulibacter sp. SYSU D01012]|uniref:CBS domain-containing protein n=1 Tax=Patulibacter sp. SYSU D01012 TaxID=2817381 RepID=UPI001B302793|nr:CBS domain-containing protein [Patulibacter sp. SYSU D01012]